jgi:putative endonuclease
MNSPINRQMTRQRSERDGRRGETIAALWLLVRGWSILGRRVRTPVGEVDLIARRGKTLAFIEVKWRRSAAEAALSLDHHRLRRVAAAADALAPRYMRDGDSVQIDAIFVTRGKLPQHMPNVWHG